MHCPLCDTESLDVLINDECACDACGHRWLPEEALEHLDASTRDDEWVAPVEAAA